MDFANEFGGAHRRFNGSYPRLRQAARAKWRACPAINVRVFTQPGDNLMAASIYGHFERVIHRHGFNPRRKQHYLQWALPFNKRIAGRIGCLSGTIYHLWHGERNVRDFRNRHKLLENFDPYSDIQIGATVPGNLPNRTSTLKNDLEPIL
jgi:hypothetical protein